MRGRCGAWERREENPSRTWAAGLAQSQVRAGGGRSRAGGDAAGPDRLSDIPPFESETGGV